MGIAETHGEIVKNLMNALEVNDRETAESFLADDFISSGWTPRPVDKNAFLNIISNLKEGIPGLIFNLHNVLEPSETTVTATIQVTGYQSDSFILPDLGTPPIPQTANSVSLPAENVSFVFVDRLIKSMSVQHVQGGGIRGLLHQLGVDLTIIQ